MVNYDKDFLRKYQKARDEKDSILCAGFDPAIPNQREKNTLPEKYFEDNKSVEEGIIAFFEEFLESVQDYCCAIKPNNQYIFHMGLKSYQKMNKMIHDQGLFSILDQKIGDIGSTNDSGFYWMKEMGFDAVTYSPFAGNIAESLNSAHKVGMGLITLTLMSNPDAIYFMKNAEIEGQKGYEFIAQKMNELNGDGIVVGATGHVTADDLQKVRELAGKDVVMLIPGIGKQEGDLKKVIQFGGENVLLNVSRAILYSENIKETAIKYNNQFNEVRKGK
ncbi:MAG: orotidine 5'-phosphate decarboxylase [Candidatus Heimdallarchaeota archaeon]|nr:orotidine 5'-phosphate decarboxylase [Candidatus Heimdallarchaeota archaeon]MBY8993545.1 orotidine 5'-phosphate decarboxylase [Candidatus Heimdallarchaeota archaeon]